MEDKNNFVCPKCGEKLLPTGTLFNQGGDMGEDGSYQIPDTPEFKCPNCKESTNF